MSCPSGGVGKYDQYLNLARELKKLWNMKVTIILIVIGAFGTVTKGLLKEMEDLKVGGWVEAILATRLLRTARILVWLFEFHGISTTMGYSMPNPVYIYELYMICNHLLYELTFSS